MVHDFGVAVAEQTNIFTGNKWDLPKYSGTYYSQQNRW